MLKIARLSEKGIELAASVETTPGDSILVHYRENRQIRVRTPDKGGWTELHDVLWAFRKFGEIEVDPPRRVAHESWLQYSLQLLLTKGCGLVVDQIRVYRAVMRLLRDGYIVLEEDNGKGGSDHQRGYRFECPRISLEVWA